MTTDSTTFSTKLSNFFSTLNELIGPRNIKLSKHAREVLRANDVELTDEEFIMGDCSIKLKHVSSVSFNVGVGGVDQSSDDGVGAISVTTKDIDKTFGLRTLFHNALFAADAMGEVEEFVSVLSARKHKVRIDKVAMPNNIFKQSFVDLA